MQFCLSPDVRLLRTTVYCTLIYNVQELHKSLIRLFEGKIGQDHVERYDYSISTKDGKSMVASNNWGAIVKKETVIVMSMIVKVSVKQERARHQKNTCPRCDETDVGVMRDDGWLQWYVMTILY